MFSKMSSDFEKKNFLFPTEYVASWARSPQVLSVFDRIIRYDFKRIALH